MTEDVVTVAATSRSPLRLELERPDVGSRGSDARDVDAAEAALKTDLNPPDDVQASGAVKTHLAGVLLRRVTKQLMGAQS